MSVAARPDPVDQLAVSLWVHGPRALLRRFPAAWGVAGDGHFLTAVPPLAVLLPVFVTIGAVVVGAGRLGYVHVYTESILLMTAAIAIGVFSAQLGTLAVTGFAVGEFFIAERSWSIDTGFYAPSEPFAQGLLGNLARVRLPMLITYLLLAVAVVVIPRTARSLVAGLGRWKPIPMGLAWPLSSGLYVLVVWIGVNTWTAAAPILVRPRFTWSIGGVPLFGGTSMPTLPTVAAISPLQVRGSELVAAAVAAALVRQLFIGLTLVPGGVRDRLRAAEASGDATKVEARSAPWSRPKQLGADLCSAVLATLVLSGILEHTWVWVLTFGVMLAVRLLRSGVVAVSVVDPWRALVGRVPAVLRLAGLWVVARVAVDALSRQAITSYTSMALCILASVAAGFVIFPGNPTLVSGEEESERAEVAS